MGASITLLIGQRTQHDAGRFRLGRGPCLRQTCCRGRGRRLGPACGGRLLGLDRRGLSLGFARSTDHAALDLLDDDLLAAAMTEALAHHARLGAWLERQRLSGDAEFFLAGVLCLAHSVTSVLLPLPCTPTASGERPVRKRVKRATRVRKVVLPGPASRAACTTFGRFSAKSNWAPVNASITKVSLISPPLFRRRAAASLRLPSPAASAAWIKARILSRPIVASTLEKPLTTAPAFAAMASASRADRSISCSVCAARSAATRTSRLKPRAKTLCLIASSIAALVAVSQMPRPGSLRFTSGTASPAGPTTKRTSSVTGLS